MEVKKFGGRVFDKAGELVFEVGPHLILEVPGFAAKMGELAAQWAHAEAELSTLLAALMNTSPERTFALLAAYKSAKATADAANSLGKVTLEGEDLAAFELMISSFRNLAEERNKVQHGIWAKRPSESDVLYRVKALEWTKFGVNILGADEKIDVADEFVSKTTEKYTVERLEELAEQIKKLAMGIILAKGRFLVSSTT